MVDQDIANPSQIGVNACGWGWGWGGGGGCVDEGGTFLSRVFYLTKREIRTHTHTLKHTHTNKHSGHP
jgi:hypothetical protein